MANLRLFASIRQAAGGERTATIPGDSVEQVMGAAVERFGAEFAELVPTCRVWVNGEPATGETPVGATDEVALLPPVSGG